ncbi:hypothetical protein RND81_05G076700 [Saponaria officinalis]|uniref:Alpha/beta hydrolase fold-3 domain-containing protein n=1 Tax=Saponaria officinalis TaxID=3572 RepID=A0AAW1KV60_SAPOF
MLKFLTNTCQYVAKIRNRHKPGSFPIKYFECIQRQQQLPFPTPHLLTHQSSPQFHQNINTPKVSYTTSTMDNEWNYKEEDILHKFFFFNVLKNGRIHMFTPQDPGSKIVPPSDDPATGVKIKDVVISPDVSARMFLPGGACTSTAKLPVVFYVHGGGFCLWSAFSIDYTSFLTRLVAECNVIAVSVEYGLFPTRPLPACYDDSWLALQWAASHGGESTNSIIGIQRSRSDLGAVIGFPRNQMTGRGIYKHLRQFRGDSAKLC